MPAKKKATGGKKKKKKSDAAKEDVKAPPPTKYVNVEICNATWKSMRFTTRMSVDEPVSKIVQQLQARHSVGIKGLRLYLGEEVVTEKLIDIELKQTLNDIGIIGGSPIFDSFRQVITYDYPPFRSVLNLPVHTPFP